jgi:hypothetical protein
MRLKEMKGVFGDGEEVGKTPANPNSSKDMWNRNARVLLEIL